MKNSTKDSIVVILFVTLIALVMLFGAFMCAVPANAEEQPPLHIPMTGGLNTNTNPFLLPDGDFVRLMNWDLSSEFGTLTLRKGFKAVTDSISNKSAPTVMRGAVTVREYNAPSSPVGERLDLIIALDTSSQPPQIADFWVGQSLRDTTSTFDNGIVSFSLPFASDTTTMRIGIANQSTGFTVGDSVYITRDTTSSNVDSGQLTGVYSYYDRLGMKYLATVGPATAGAGQWSSLYLSRESGYNITFKLLDYIFKGETPVWTTWNGAMLLALGRQRPVLWDGKFARPIQPRAPGQIEAVPIPATAGALDGFYRYGLLQRFQDGTFASHMSYTTRPIQANDENMLLHSFIANAPDTFNAAPDIMRFVLMRTHGYPAGISPVVDTFFSIDTVEATFAQLDTLTIIDARFDSTLTDTVLKLLVYPIDSAKFSDSTNVLDSVSNAFSAVQNRFTGMGGMRYIATHRDSPSVFGSPFLPDSLADPKDSNYAYTEYFYTNFDTISGAESDKSVSLIVPVKRPLYDTTDKNISAYELGIPKVLSSDSGIVRKIYKAQGYWSKFFDTTVTVIDTHLRITDKVIQFDTDGEEEYRTVKDTVYIPRERDKKVAKFELHTTIPVAIEVLTNPLDSIFTDTLTWIQALTGLLSGADTLNLRRQAVDVNFWSPQINLTGVSYIYPYGGRVWYAIGSRLYRSELDVAGIVRPFQDVAFNLDDGDAITVIAGAGPNLHIYKNFSTTVLYDPLNDLPRKGSQTFGIGCVAPQSMQEWGGKRYYLSADGVIVEQVAEFKDYGIKQGLVSTNINSILIGDRSLATLKGAVAAPIFDDKYVITFPGIDTSFVYHLQIDKWSTWDFSFSQATLYDTLTTEGLVRSSDVVFAKSGDERLFRYASSDTFHYDSGTSTFVEGVFETKPIFADHNQWQITTLGIHRDTGIIGNVVLIGDSADASVANITFGATSRDYAYKGLGVNESRWFRIKYTTNLVTTNRLNRIYGLDVWGRVVSRPILK